MLPILNVKKLFTATALLLIAQGTLSAQSARPSVEARFSTDSVLIGDQFLLEVEVNKDVMEVIEFPLFDNGHLGDSSDLESLSETGIDTLKADGRRITLRKSYTLTSFNEGNYHAGKFPVLYIDKNVIDTLWSRDSLQLIVNTLAVDTVKQTIHDVKVPMHTPIRFGEFSGYLAAGLIGALVLALLIYILVKRLRNKPLLSGKKTPHVPPHVIAIKNLEALHARKLWQSGKHKAYYTGITDILRDYLSDRYGVKAMELTSPEILSRMAQESLNDKATQRLRDILITADFVKFAKYAPAGEQNETVYTEAYYFIEETKAPDEEPIPATTDVAQTDKKENNA